MEIKEEKINKSREFDLRSFWKKLWRLLTPSHRAIINLLIFTLLLEILRLIGPYILKLIIDIITSNFNAEMIGRIVWLIVIMLLSNQAMSLLDYLVDKKVFITLVDAIYYLSSNAHKKMVFLSLGYHEKENTGNKIVKIIRGVDKIDNLFGNFFWEVAPTIFQIILTTITLFIIDWRFGVIIMVFVPVFVLLTLKVNKDVFPYRIVRFDKQEESTGIMTQSILNINTVKSFVQEWREYNEFSSSAKGVKDNFILEFGRVLKFNILRNLTIDLGRASLLFFGIYLAWQGNITVGSLVFVYTISEKALLSLFRISRLYDRIMESGEAVERLYDLSLEESEIKNKRRGIKPKDVEGKIEFKNVTFVYNESKTKALDRVTFEIRPGCVTAIVGPSGGGKTTVARMAYRHYDPTGGRVFLDGKDLREYDLYSFRKFMAIVPQEVEIFNTRVRDNISYAKPNASIKEIKAAAKIANAEEFILQLKDGYDTLVGERGIKLSGGQRQRIGIARAILANPRILIFDEATSSLDSYSERLIQEALDKIRKNRTVIIIAHRLSTIKKADKLVVLEKGKVVEEGSHLELSRLNGGLYQKLLDLQKMGDVE
jgi:ABC-type multidrug transport system fused ATPase/permease subunit